MSRKRVARRFAVPIALTAGVITIAAGAGVVMAAGASDLPKRTAAQLLTAVETSDVKGLSGTVVQNADLGLPSMDGTGGTLSSIASGTHQMRVWYGSPDKARIAMLDDYGETDAIRNGEDLWQWNSKESKAVHTTLPKKLADMPMWPPTAITAEASSPQKLAERALKDIAPTTKVSVGDPVEVAGRDAYQLVLRPKDDSALVSSINLAIDGETGVPLRTQIYGTNVDKPAFDVAFSRISFSTPDKENFTFTPPKGVKVKEEKSDWPKAKHHADGKHPKADVKTVGDGWATVWQTHIDVKKALSDAKKDGKGSHAKSHGKSDGFDPSAMLGSLPKVHGDWGSGHLFKSALVNALITDDGRILVGSVTPQRLYEVAAHK
ncbi:MAG TPA: hypothetical protein VE172_01920 [Stackebrandtia sp.]|jgi:outer membrane lipoprotein-sorting protein|uniref:LolA family protein n=1 Tax=Stackebrandtia sp. TaxID=2023065 RepID=UPI002D4D40D1|nr:hypothetical protein [Stackebrandtia sp.]HZE37542.1 hypothetical protein [Stackebrandtia sp.]